MEGVIFFLTSVRGYGLRSVAYYDSHPSYCEYNPNESSISFAASRLLWAAEEPTLGASSGFSPETIKSVSYIFRSRDSVGPNSQWGNTKEVSYCMFQNDSIWVGISASRAVDTFNFSPNHHSRMDFSKPKYVF